MKKIIFSIVFLIALAWGCKKDFVVADISKKTVKVNAPANNTTTTINLVTFWWDAVDGAEQYNLQLVKPDFANTVQLLLDTNVTLTKFNFSLKPGNYQWRIRASNAGHTTTYQVFNLKIDTTSNLSDQLVNRISPANGAVTGNTVVTFNWSALTVAKKYRLQINEGLILDTTLIGKTSLIYSLPAAKGNLTPYTWNVKAINDASESQFNVASFTVTIDRKGPSVPALTFPIAVNGTMKGADTLKWTRATDTKYDSVYVAEDSLFLINPNQLRTDVNSLEVSEFGLPPNVLGTFYWWKVRSFDLYGNPSGYSYRRKFTITP